MISEPLGWQEAETNCQSYGGHLVSMTNPVEMGYVIAKMSEAGQDDVWIGLGGYVNTTDFFQQCILPFDHWRFPEQLCRLVRWLAP